MAILIDPPRWPAHGTRWSHLVSDRSYDELHEFARALRLPRRAFDVDHYDVAESLYERAVALGARPVSGTELVRALIASGLRVSKRRNPELVADRRLEYLVAEWRGLGERLDLAPSARRDDGGWASLGAELLERWQEPHRRYHDARHLEDVLLALDHLALVDEAPTPASLLAAWFHDAVHRGAAGDDERDSAEIAAAALPRAGVDPALAIEVHDYVLATDGHSPGDGAPHGLRQLLDADLSILGAGEPRYRAYTRSVREEYAHVPREAFRKGRARILEGFLERPRIYRTGAGAALWEARARRNLAGELAALRRD
ncbi:MAG: DUF4031 domain-containing protein [Microbacteriaceae bacterium]|nr:DUF4031 domain-containing protein [Microbacteriaceae bacterium]